jgi:osmotically-inducible protein OsmY
MKTDSQIQQDVLAELKWEPAVNAAHIAVEVKDGIVTLAGHVSSFPEKWEAEQAARRVAGVKALAIEMKVILPGSGQRTDADIARYAENALHWTSYLPKDRVKIRVEKGWLTLSGDVDWEYQRQTAENAVRYLAGVTGVSNTLAIKTQVSVNAVKSDIEAALKRRATADAKNIAVSVHGNTVTLTGTVHSWSERDTARHSAWGTPGVSDVIDDMAISF